MRWGDVESRIPAGQLIPAFAYQRPAFEFKQFVDGSLFDLNVIAADQRARILNQSVEWNSILPCHDRQRVSSYLVNDVSILRASIGTDDHRVDRSFGHYLCGGAIRNDRNRNAASR